MTEWAIRLEGISKKYRIGGQRERYRTLRDILANSLASPATFGRRVLRRSPRRVAPEELTIWALKDVSLEINRGEVVGVIGRNGAGKSTLLKILSRITEPTSGYAEIRGRVGSLLEVGTGFHLELTGRENVFLSGAILGMKRQEIERKFDEIVDFAGVERFIDTPVKHYSSGMHLRLAFSVAAHLEPEILLVDEVLAVGDVAFQKKCLGKMDDVASEGRTVLFVSHNLGVIKELCRTSVVIDQGRISYRGPVVEGLARYSESVVDAGERYHFNGAGWRGLRVNGTPGCMASIVSGHDPIVVESLLKLRDDAMGGYLYFIMNDSIGNVVVHQRVRSEELLRGGDLPTGSYQLTVDLPALWLAPGVYSLYFKFIGRGTTGAEERYFSERAVLDVHGSTNGISRAHLAPPVAWRLHPETAFNGQPVLTGPVR